MKRKPKSCARKCERYCCSIVRYVPLGFVYGLTTWAVWIEAGIGFHYRAIAGTGRYFFVGRVIKLMTFLPPRLLDLRRRYPPLRSSQLVIQHCCLYRSRFPSYNYRVLPLTNPRAICAPRSSCLYRQIQRRSSLLQEMSSQKTRSSPSLFNVRTMCVEDGSSLSLASYLRGNEELQALSAFPDLHYHILLAVLWGHRDLAMEGNYERWRVRRNINADQRCPALYDIRNHWAGPDWLHWMAS